MSTLASPLDADSETPPSGTPFSVTWPLIDPTPACMRISTPSFCSPASKVIWATSVPKPLMLAESVYVPGVLTPVNEKRPALAPDVVAELNVRAPSLSTISTLPSGPLGPTTEPLTEPRAGFSSTGSSIGLPSPVGVTTKAWVS